MKKIIVLFCAMILFVNTQAHCPTPPTTNFPSCQCTNKFSANRNYYDCGFAKEYSKWEELWENHIICNGVAFHSVGRSGFLADAHTPFKLVLPEFTINFTPKGCVTNISIGTRYEPAIWWRDSCLGSGFNNYENFDRTTRSSFDALLAINSSRGGIDFRLRELLHNLLLEIDESVFGGYTEWDYYDYEYSDNENEYSESNKEDWFAQANAEYIRLINNFIQQLNDRNNIAIPLKSDYCDEISTTDLIMETLSESNICLRDFILNEFVFQNGETAETANHIVTEDELWRLERIFYGNRRPHSNPLTLKLLEQWIAPTHSVSFGNLNQIGIEFSTDIIQPLDKSKSKNSETQQIVILADLFGNRLVRYSNKEGLSAQIQRISPAAFRISGTDISFSFVEPEPTPGYWQSNKIAIQTGINQGRENRFPDVNGLRISDAEFHIPYKNDRIIRTANGLFFNCHLFFGEFYFSIRENQSSEKFVTVNTQKRGTIEISLEELKELFLSFGVFDVDFVERGRYLAVRLTKTTKKVNAIIPNKFTTFAFVKR